MPMIDLTVPVGRISRAKRDALVDSLVSTLLKMEGVPPESERARAIAWAFVDEKPVGDIYVGGKPSSYPIYRAQVTVPAGALDAERKDELVKLFTSAILQAAGEDESDESKGRVWCLIRELPDGNWGALGRVFSFRDIARYIQSGKVPDKQKELKVTTPS
jgi:phenylpyruvate tautomerase PptA (4-oxalocrotonate tautomerase family)